MRDFKDNIWAADLAEMGSISSTKQGIKYLLCVINFYSKYAWVKLLKEKKTKTVPRGFIEIVMNINVNPINLGSTKEKNFIIALCKKLLDNN